MSEPSPSRDRNVRGSVRTVSRAAARGFVAFVVVAGVGQVIGFAEWFALHRPFGVRLPVKVGWLYFLGFHRVGIDLRGPALSPTTNLVAVRIHLALLTGTALAAVVLFLSGKRSGTGTATTRVGIGLAVAAGYAGPAFLGSVPVSLRFPSAGISVRPVLWECAVMPLTIAAVSATAGSLWPLATSTSSRWGRWAYAGVVGGLRMFAFAIAFGVIGLVLLAGLRPDGAAAYWRGVVAGGPARAVVILSHQALLLPNQSILVLTPAMGACDVGTSSAGSMDLLCFGRQPVARIVADLGLAGGVPPSDDGMPAAFFALLAAPAGAVIWGGLLAAEPARGPERWLIGPASGIVYGVVFGLGVVAATISVSAPGSTIVRGRTSVGPELPASALFALGWGVVGGTVGAVLGGLGRSPKAAQLVEEPAP